MIWLEDEGWNAQNSAIYSLIRKLTRSERWSRSISQYNLISSSFESKPSRCLKLLGIDEMMRQMHVNQKDLNVDLQGFFFEHLLKNAEKIKEDLNVCDKNVRSKIIGQRGDGVLEREGLLRDYKWCTTEVEFSRSILVWHFATDICYRADKDASKEYERSRCLSEYMMYLLVIRPNMLSKGFGDDEGYLETLRELRDLKYSPYEYQFTLREYRCTLRELWRLKDQDDEGYRRTLREFRNSVSRVYDDGDFQRQWKAEKSVLSGVAVLARQLLLVGRNEVWVEMLIYAAAHCPWKEHTHQLRRGGELLTHVSLLMLHLGLTEQYEFNEFKDSFSDLKGEEQEEYYNAREKFFKSTADMSGSSSNEEVKELKKIVADTKRELEREKQEREREKREFEQLRSYLTALAPQQGIDSLPRSLLAQTDDQGTGQPPSNNEISLSIE